MDKVLIMGDEGSGVGDEVFVLYEGGFGEVVAGGAEEVGGKGEEGVAEVM